jgi:hypothetical protein
MDCSVIPAIRVCSASASGATAASPSIVSSTTAASRARWPAEDVSSSTNAASRSDLSQDPGSPSLGLDDRQQPGFVHHCHSSSPISSAASSISAALTFRQPGECLGDSFCDSTGLEALVRRPLAAGRIQRLNRHCRAAVPNLVDTKIISDSVRLRANVRPDTRP